MSQYRAPGLVVATGTVPQTHHPDPLYPGRNPQSRHPRGCALDLRKQQKNEAEAIREKLAPLAPVVTKMASQLVSDIEFKGLDPEPLLQIRPEDKGLEIMDESVFLRQVVSCTVIDITL